METVPRESRVVKFSVFEADLDAGELRKSGVRQKLAAQPFQVLQLLLEHPQEIVTREQLQQRIWPNGVVVDYDLALKKAVNRIREVLGDLADSPRFIETVPRRGYRFIAPLNGHGSTGRVAELPVEAPSTSSRGRFRFRVALICGLGAAPLVAILVLMPSNSWRRLLGKPAVPQIRSLAVLPLQNLSADPAQEYFADGMTDALITDLAQMGSLKVISRTSTMPYKQTTKSLPEIARELNVDGIVEGTVQRSGDRVRITAQLIHGPSDKHLWANSYERDLHDIFTLEREVSDDIANQVRTQITTRDQSPVQPQPVDEKVLDAYLQGSYHLNKGAKGLRDEELRKAGELFQQAIDAEPDFVPAYIGLSLAHDNLFWSSSKDFAIMRASAAKAVALAPASPEAHGAVANVKWEEWDWVGAEDEERRALKLNPNNAWSHDGLGNILSATGRMDEAWKEYEIAQQLDPNQDHLAGALYHAGQYDRSIRLLQRTLDAGPDDAVARYFLSQAYARQGKHAESIQEFVIGATLIGHPEISNHVNSAFSTSGWTGALLQEAKELERLMATKQVYVPGILAQIYAQLGDNDKVFYWLEEGCKHHRSALSDPVLQWTKVEPAFAPLRSDPRFKLVLRHMGLPE